MVGDLCESGLYVIVRGYNLGFLRGGNLPGDGRCLFERWKKDRQLDERCVRKFGFVNVRTMLRNGEALGSPAGEPAHLSGEPEFDGVDDAALARPIRA